MDDRLDNQTLARTRWHPRVTPFRLTSVLLTTTLGIAKAILVSEGDTVGSTTVEWVAGVLLALRSACLSDSVFGIYMKGTFTSNKLAVSWRFGVF